MIRHIIAAQEIRILFDEIDLEEDANISIILTRSAQICIDNASELQNVLRIIVDESLDYSESCETYVDMICALCARYPEFPTDDSDNRPDTFNRILNNILEEEYDIFHEWTFDNNPEDMMSREIWAEGFVTLIVHLFLRGLIAQQILARVMENMLGLISIRERARTKASLPAMRCFLARI